MNLGIICNFVIKYFLREYLGLIISRKHSRPSSRWSLSFTDELHIEVTPRFTEEYINLLGRRIKIIDSASFRFLWDELFVKEIYRFKSRKESLYIIDCGANIGLSVIYFKMLYPKAEIIAFEPDNKIFEVLKYNMEACQFQNVQIVNKAVWSKETKLFFVSDGSDGGRISNDIDEDNSLEITTVGLREYLTKPIDFLKIDIEGAEVEVLTDCADMLDNVEKIFIEYHSFVDRKQELDTLLRILHEAGFRYYISHVGITSLHPLERVINFNKIENQLNIYAYREA